MHQRTDMDIPRVVCYDNGEGRYVIFFEKGRQMRSHHLMSPCYADLHIHSCFSDGSLTPSQITQRAIDQDILVIAISDHDTVQGVEEALDLANQMKITAIPACEISTAVGNREVHILGYYLDWRNTQLNKKLEWLRRMREWRVREMVRRLSRIGISIHPDDVFAISGSGSTGRIHVALAIIQKGYEATLSDVFRKYIGYRGSAYVPKVTMSTEEAIDLILLADGIPVYAHPGISQMDQCIPAWTKRGLKGIEAFHSSQDQNQVQFYLKLAQKYNLCVTGGSDCHGTWKGPPLIGKVKLPYSYVEILHRMKTRG